MKKLLEERAELRQIQIKLNMLSITNILFLRVIVFILIELLIRRVIDIRQAE
jgi:hypothetical protein